MANSITASQVFNFSLLPHWCWVLRFPAAVVAQDLGQLILEEIIVTAQGLVVVEVFVTQGQGIDPLRSTQTRARGCRMCRYRSAYWAQTS